MVTVAVPLGCLLYCAAVALALDLFAVSLCYEWDVLMS